MCYDDGDEEILNLKREKWAVIYDESASDKVGSFLIYITSFYLIHVLGC